MQIELDHLLICTSPGAPEAERLAQFGLWEGPPNHHPGQGTANRRFSLRNAMIELLWVNDPSEAQSERTRRTQLWERWTERDRRACPFGICVRPLEDARDELPFPAWAYQPSYLPSPLALHIAEAGLAEPMWVYLGFMRRSTREKYFLENSIGIREITRVVLHTPAPLQSVASQTMIENRVISSHLGNRFLLEIEFDGKPNRQSKDFRPHLPLLFHY
jgi:Glyoxalase-like domain